MAATLGSLTTSLAGANNDMVFTARFPGRASNKIKIKYTDPGTETATESVSVTFDSSTGITLIDVTLRSVSSVLSTAAQVKTAIEANGDAAALVTVAASGGDTLATSVTAMAATALSAGVGDTSTGYDSADAMEDDGWKLSNVTVANGDAVYRAEVSVDGELVCVATDDATSRIHAAWLWKSLYLAKGGNPLSINGGGTVD